MSRKVVTGEVRASYVNVFQPRLNDLSGKREYSMTILVPKDDTDTVGKLKAAVEAAKQDKWGNNPPPHLDIGIRDGDGQKPRGGEYGLECKGHWVINTKANEQYQPAVVDAQLNPVINPQDFRSGDYCRVSVTAYAYDHKGNKGVSFGLNNIQVLRRGDPLGGGSRPEEDFEAYVETDEAAGSASTQAADGVMW